MPITGAVSRWSTTIYDQSRAQLDGWRRCFVGTSAAPIRCRMPAVRCAIRSDRPARSSSPTSRRLRLDRAAPRLVDSAQDRRCRGHPGVSSWRPAAGHQPWRWPYRDRTGQPMPVDWQRSLRAWRYPTRSSCGASSTGDWTGMSVHRMAARGSRARGRRYGQQRHGQGHCRADRPVRLGLAERPDSMNARLAQLAALGFPIRRRSASPWRHWNTPATGASTGIAKRRRSPPMAWCCAVSNVRRPSAGRPSPTGPQPGSTRCARR